MADLFNTFIVVYKTAPDNNYSDDIYSSKELAEEAIKPLQLNNLVVITLDDYIDAVKSERYDQGYENGRQSEY